MPHLIDGGVDDESLVFMLTTHKADVVVEVKKLWRVIDEEEDDREREKDTAKWESVDE